MYTELRLVNFMARKHFVTFRTEHTAGTHSDKLKGIRQSRKKNLLNKN